MPEEFPEFESEAAMAEWFETADLSEYRLEEALEVVVTRIHLSVGGQPAGSGTQAQTGTLREPFVTAAG